MRMKLLSVDLARTGLCQGTDVGKETKVFMLHMKSLKAQQHPSLSNGKFLQQPSNFLDLDRKTEEEVSCSDR